MIVFQINRFFIFVRSCWTNIVIMNRSCILVEVIFKMAQNEVRRVIIFLCLIMFGVGQLGVELGKNMILRCRLFLNLKKKILLINILKHLVINSIGLVILKTLFLAELIHGIFLGFIVFYIIPVFLVFQM